MHRVVIEERSHFAVEIVEAIVYRGCVGVKARPREKNGEYRYHGREYPKEA